MGKFIRLPGLEYSNIWVKYGLNYLFIRLYNPRWGLADTRIFLQFCRSSVNTIPGTSPTTEHFSTQYIYLFLGIHLVPCVISIVLLKTLLPTRTLFALRVIPTELNLTALFLKYYDDFHIL